MFDLWADDFPKRRDELLDGLLEQAPVLWHPPGTNERMPGGFWTVARYDDVLTVKRNPDVFSSFETTSIGMTPGTFAHEVGSRRLSGNDGDYHDVVRKLCGKSLRPSVLKSYMEALVTKAASGLDRFEAQLRAGDTVDWVRDFAYMFPVFAVGLLIGLPEDLMDGFADQYAAGSPPTEEQLETAFADFVRHRVDHPADDMTSELIAAIRDGNPYLDLDALHFNVVGFYLAGHLTTTHLMAWVLIELQNHPELRDVLRADHDRIPGFIEETLRFNCPIVATFNTVIKDATIEGQRLEPGQHVFSVYGAANRDPRMFDDPMSFDITRSPNPHLAFSHGTHFCLGAPLARLETKLMIEDLLERDLPLRIDTDNAVRMQNTFGTLPVALAT